MADADKWVSPLRVETYLTASRRVRGRRTACTAGVDALVAPSTYTKSTLTPILSGEHTLGRADCIFNMALMSGLLLAADCSPDGGVRLVMYVFDFCLFWAALEHTDNAGVVRRNAAYRGRSTKSDRTPGPFPACFGSVA